MDRDDKLRDELLIAIARGLRLLIENPRPTKLEVRDVVDELATTEIKFSGEFRPFAAPVTK